MHGSSSAEKHETSEVAARRVADGYQASASPIVLERPSGQDVETGLCQGREVLYRLNASGHDVLDV